MKLLGIYNLPAMVTMAGLVCALSAILLALNKQAELAVVALIWAGVFDLFDGLVARSKVRSRVESEFGVQIDSIVDIVSFGVTPIVVAVSLGMNGVISILISLIYLCATAQRLAYFNVTQANSESDTSKAVEYYQGLPVTFAALIFSIGFSLKGFLSPNHYTLYLNILFLVTACLYVLPFAIPKPKKLVYVIMPSLAIMFSVYWLILGLGS
jgi:CDP-diacylglycerol--serine O-phosphatidyltransferase